MIVQIILIALNAIFASAELAVLSVNEAKLERMAEEGNRRAKRLYKLTREPAKFLSTIQIAITLSGFLGSAFAADGFSDPLVDWLMGLGVPLPRATLDTISVILITLILSYFTLVFGELVPKRVALKKSETLALALSGLVNAISFFFKPVVWVLSISTNAVLRLFRIDPSADEEAATEEEIRMMVETSREKGAIAQEEQSFIENVFEFDDLEAGDILTHRTDVEILWLEDSDEVWADTIRNTRFTRYPICDDSPDNVVAILNTKDYFRLESRDRETVMTQAVEEPYFVPETVMADVLFRNMKASRHSMAVVLDEYGGVVGIVTLSDLIEELVGGLKEEDLPEDDSDRIEMLGEDHWMVYGNVELEDLEEVTGLSLETEEFHTFSGYVISLLNDIPKDGYHDIVCKADELVVRVLEVENHQIVRAEVRRIGEEEKGEAERS